jgi:hypothetical protein
MCQRRNSTQWHKRYVWQCEILAGLSIHVRTVYDILCCARYSDVGTKITHDYIRAEYNRLVHSDIHRSTIWRCLKTLEETGLCTRTGDAIKVVMSEKPLRRTQCDVMSQKTGLTRESLRHHVAPSATSRRTQCDISTSVDPVDPVDPSVDPTLVVKPNRTKQLHIHLDLLRANAGRRAAPIGSLARLVGRTPTSTDMTHEQIDARRAALKAQLRTITEETSARAGQTHSDTPKGLPSVRTEGGDE